MGEEFDRGVCNSMRWWNQPSFSCSKEISHQSIDWINQPLPPVEFDHIATGIIEDSSINPLKEAFLPGFFEPDPVEELNKLNPNHFFNFSNNTDPFWEPSANLPPVQDVDFDSRNLTMRTFVTKESGSDPVTKRPRLETPSLLPTFKVRKEKLGDRITALQQLVSPFGKTDTASVLHEAIDYIKFLHDQVDVLTTPYFKNGHQMPQQKGLKRSKDCKEEANNQGLCLVPISSTFAVASEFPMDFWSPYNFGGS